MFKTIQFFILTCSIFFFMPYVHAQKFEIFKGDTINQEDAAGLKKGHWMVYNRTKKLADYTDDQLVEEGPYINNRKEGIWKAYHNNGKLKSEITYVSGRPNGFSKFYYKSGLPNEEGNWVNGKWDGSYKFYYENGQISYDWKYVNGKREGVQLYYHDNGNKLYEGGWKDGQENGELKEYNREGQLVAVKVFKAGGKIDTVASKTFKPVPGEKGAGVVSPTVIEKPHAAVESVIEEDTERAWLGYKESGFHKVKTKGGFLIREGVFDNGTFMSGKAYKYVLGKLAKTIVYKNGKAIEVIENR
jgi:antitoxin component YwqK of YwqJK toxin-antitoxin module